MSYDKISYLSTNSFTKRYFSCVKLNAKVIIMNNFASSFLLGLVCTLFLLILSVIITLGVKMLFLMHFDFAKPKAVSKQVKPSTAKTKKPSPKNTAKPKPIPKAIRSIEIDPEQIDKIYVKKTS